MTHTVSIYIYTMNLAHHLERHNGQDHGDNKAGVDILNE